MINITKLIIKKSTLYEKFNFIKFSKCLNSFLLCFVTRHGWYLSMNLIFGKKKQIR